MLKLKIFILAIFFLAFISGALYFFNLNFLNKNIDYFGVLNQSEQPFLDNNSPMSVIQESKSANVFSSPMDRAQERITKKTFGMFITPATSPIQPEKFSGFHTGVDWEIFPEEINSEVPVRAICSGNLSLKRNASGYGGATVQECEFENAPITVVYGHLNLKSISFSQGEKIKVGEIIGVLGKDKSLETDGERKHLHLAIHRGKNIELLGYVGSEQVLSAWIDPCLFVCEKN
jgi:murein DD-endopeptidase MepM/ murein hydrolase activator NlpD